MHYRTLNTMTIKSLRKPGDNKTSMDTITLLHRALLTSFLCKQTSVTTLTVVRYLHPASIFNPGNPHIQKNQSYRLLYSVVASTFVSRDVNVRNFYRQSLKPRKSKSANNIISV